MMTKTLSLQTSTNILPVSIVLHQVGQEHQTDLLHLILQVYPIRVSGHENSCGEGMFLKLTGSPGLPSKPGNPGKP